MKPGARWKKTIRQAKILLGDFFIVCFSDDYTSKTKSYMNEGKTLITGDLQNYTSDLAWSIAVLLSECDH
jgi:hypothetical protein